MLDKEIDRKKRVLEKEIEALGQKEALMTGAVEVDLQGLNTVRRERMEKQDKLDMLKSLEPMKKVHE